MKKRQISIDQLNDALQQPSFQYIHDNILKTGFYDPVTKIFVAVADDIILTVIDNVTPQYIQNLLEK